MSEYIITPQLYKRTFRYLNDPVLRSSYKARNLCVRRDIVVTDLPSGARRCFLLLLTSA